MITRQKTRMTAITAYSAGPRTSGLEGEVWFSAMVVVKEGEVVVDGSMMVGNGGLSVVERGNMHLLTDCRSLKSPKVEQLSIRCST